MHYNASREPAEKLAEEIRAAGGTVHLIQGDVSREGETERVVEETAKTFGHLDGLINNAGGMLGRKPTSEYTDAHYAAVMDLNARSVLAATRAAHPWLKKQGGFIINTTSIAARNGGGNGAILYAASKGFVSTITRGHAKEFVADRIRVNAVAPGVIATPFHERYTDDEQMELQRRSIPMGFVAHRRIASALSLPRLANAFGLHHRADHRGQWRPADAVNTLAGAPHLPFPGGTELSNRRHVSRLVFSSRGAP